MTLSHKIPTLFSLHLIILIAGFSVSFGQIIKDADGNLYTSVKIGTQVWMVENLSVTRLNNGTPIKNAVKDDIWAGISGPAYCWFNNDPGKKEDIGALYNFYAVETGKLCPVGWHVPSKNEWAELIIYLDDPNTAGARIKSTHADYWRNNLVVTTDEFGFSALPGGSRLAMGEFPMNGDFIAVWWTSTRFNDALAWNHGIFFNTSKIYGGSDHLKCGFSVRCIKDR
jgi:uncharacterized protein (TIGR02145 family)